MRELHQMAHYQGCASWGSLRFDIAYSQHCMPRGAPSGSAVWKSYTRDRTNYTILLPRHPRETLLSPSPAEDSDTIFTLLNSYLFCAISSPGKEWEALGKSLGLTNARIEAIRTRNKAEPDRAKEDMLLTWMKRQARGPDRVRWITVVNTLLSLHIVRIVGYLGGKAPDS